MTEDKRADNRYVRLHSAPALSAAACSPADLKQPIGVFDMDCGCMKRPARVAACSRGGVENGSVKSDIPASRGLLR